MLIEWLHIWLYWRPTYAHLLFYFRLFYPFLIFLCWLVREAVTLLSLLLSNVSQYLACAIFYYSIRLNIYCDLACLLLLSRFQ